MLKLIPKKYREHITSITAEKSNDYNEKGQQLINYTVIWDNGEEHTFQNQKYMITAIKENTVNGYYVSP